MFCAIHELGPKRFKGRLAVELWGFSMCFDLDRVPSSSEELESVELSSEFDSWIGVRFFLVLLLHDTLLDALRSSIRLEEVRRLCLARV